MNTIKIIILRLLSGLLLGLFLSGITVAAPVNLPKTGQTNCYAEDGAQINCAGTGQDADIQAGADWPSPRFTNHNDGTITDNLTGLMWMQDGNFLWRNLNAPEWLAALSLVDSLNAKAADPNYNGIALPGAPTPYTDWRLPNIIEMESLANASQRLGHLWLESQGFIKMSAGFWTSTTYASDNFSELGYGWFANLLYGGAIGDRLKEISSNSGSTGAIIGVRTASKGNATWRTGQTLCYNDFNRYGVPALVYADTIIDCANTGQDGEMLAGVAWPSPRFTDNGDGTVTDNLTGLVWLQDANCISSQYPDFDVDTWEFGKVGDGGVTWQHALDFVAGINAGTYANCGGSQTDWHLPNKRELQSLIDFSKVNAINLPDGHPFTNVIELGYWTSTTKIDYDTKPFDNALVVQMGSGRNVWGIKSGLNKNNILTEVNYVWPVRIPAPAIVPEISVSPIAINFNNVLVNTLSAPVPVTISNTGNANLRVFSILSLNTQNFILDISGGANPCGISSPVIASGENCTLSVAFKPDAVAMFNGSLVINSNSLVSEGSTEMNLKGAGVASSTPDIAVKPSSHVFGDVIVNQLSSSKTFVLSNIGNVALNVSAIGLTTGTDYQLNLNTGANPCAVNNPVIDAGSSCTVGVIFAPTVVANNLSDSLLINSNDPNEASVITMLSGNGVSVTPPPSTDVTPPVVVSVTPANNSGRVPATISEITATFNESVLGINSATFVAASGAVISATVEYDAAARTARLKPAADLAFLTRYTVNISSAQVRDLADNNLAQDYSWSFTTGGDPASGGCDPEIGVETGCMSFDNFDFGTGVLIDTYGCCTSGPMAEYAARRSVTFGQSVSDDSMTTADFKSEATATINSTKFSLQVYSERKAISEARAGAEANGASKIDVKGVPPGTLIPMSFVLSGSFASNGGTLILQVYDFDAYRLLASVAVSGSGSRITYTRMIDVYGSQNDASNLVTMTDNGSSNIRVDFLYPAIPDNGIYAWFIGGVHNAISSGKTNYTARLVANPPPGVTVTLASGEVFTGDVDTDADGVSDSKDSAPNNAAIATPDTISGQGSITLDASANVGVTLSQVRVLDDDDPSLLQDGKPANQTFPDGLVSFRLNGLAPGATATVNLNFVNPIPAGGAYYKVSDTGFYAFPGAVISADRRSVVLTITDGGTGDNDNAANGVIIDPGGVAVPVIKTPAAKGDSGSNIFGCSMNSGSNQVGFDPILLLMSLISFIYLYRSGKHAGKS